MLFDLDGFKGYNDSFGHPAGDALLARLGAKLAKVPGDAGSVYRLGGDEFCLSRPWATAIPKRSSTAPARRSASAAKGSRSAARSVR